MDDFFQSFILRGGKKRIRKRLLNPCYTQEASPLGAFLICYGLSWQVSLSSSVKFAKSTNSLNELLTFLLFSNVGTWGCFLELCLWHCWYTKSLPCAIGEKFNPQNCSTYNISQYCPNGDKIIYLMDNKWKFNTW